MFDEELIVAINTSLNILNQLGVGQNGFSIEDDEGTWEDFLGDSESDLQAVKSYVTISVRLLFDPPQNSFLVDILNKQRDELAWRLNVMVDPGDEDISVEEDDEDEL